MFSSSNNNSLGLPVSAPTTPKSSKEDVKEKPSLVCVHVQRIPANAKVIRLIVYL